MLTIDPETPQFLFSGLSCPDSYVMGPCDTCYKFEHAKTTWHKAQAMCMQDGGALVSVNSEPKAAALAGIMALRGQYLGFFSYSSSFSLTLVQGVGFVRFMCFAGEAQGRLLPPTQADNS